MRLGLGIGIVSIWIAIIPAAAAAPLPEPPQEVQDHWDVCVNFDALLAPPCNFVDRQAGENNAIGNLAIGQYRPPHLRPSLLYAEASALATGGDPSSVDLGDVRLAGGEWTPVSTLVYGALP